LGEASGAGLIVIAAAMVLLTDLAERRRVSRPRRNAKVEVAYAALATCLLTGGLFVVLPTPS
jgi:hypothetical protein